MGCCSSKNEPDPITGLTPTQAQAIISSWENLNPECSSLLFKQLFMIFPEKKAYFGFAKSELVDKILNSEEMIAHMGATWKGLDKLVLSTQTGTRFAAIGKGLGYNHFKFEIDRQDVHKFMDFFKQVLKDDLKSQFHGDLEEAWNIWCKAVEDVFIMGYNEALFEEQQHHQQHHQQQQQQHQLHQHHHQLHHQHQGAEN